MLPRCDVRPEILRWARASICMDVPTAAKRLKVPATTLELWETSGATLSFTRVEKIAEAYRIPSAGLLFAAVPVDPPLPVDRRTMASQAEWELSLDFVLAVRFAQALQETVVEIGVLEDQKLPSGPSFEVGATAADAAAKMRMDLGLSLAEQAGFKNASDALKAWTTLVESLGVHVLYRRWSIGEGRAFSLAGDVPVIVLNDSDKDSAKVFSLFHELAHVCLGETGVCDMYPAGYDQAHGQTETFCNAFAAELLVPSDALLRHRLVRSHVGSSWNDSVLSALAREFAVSRETVLRRLLTHKKTTPEFYEAQRERFAMEFAEYMARLSKARKRSSGGPPWPDRVIHNHGQRFSKSVVTAFADGRISATEAGTYFGTTPRHIDGIRDRIQ